MNKAFRTDENVTKALGGGTAYVYRLDPPFDYKDGWGEDATDEKAKYALASGTWAPMSGPETLVFPCDEEGVVTDWGEIAGGRGYVDPDAAIEGMGYTIEILEKETTK